MPNKAFEITSILYGSRSLIYLNDVSLPFRDRLNIKPYPDFVISGLPATSSSESNSAESTSLWSSCRTMVTLTKLVAHPSWATERVVFQGGSVHRVNLVGWKVKTCNSFSSHCWRKRSCLIFCCVAPHWSPPYWTIILPPLLHGLSSSSFVSVSAGSEVINLASWNDIPVSGSG